MMKHVWAVLGFLLITAGHDALSAEPEDFRSTGYIGLGVGFAMENVPRQTTSLHGNGSLAYRVMPHTQLALGFNYFSFTGQEDFDALEETYCIIALGAEGKLNTRATGLGPSVHALYGVGYSKLERGKYKPYYSVGVGVETSVSNRLGLFVQTRYFWIDTEESISFANVVVGVAFLSK